MCAVCYLLASLSPMPILGLAGCALCGMAVGIMWPGSISISSRKCPKGGTAMFALLALAGDCGCGLGPAVVGFVSGALDDNLKLGIVSAVVFPLILFTGLLITKRNGYLCFYLSISIIRMPLGLKYSLRFLAPLC